MPTIFVIDATRSGSEHASFNAAVIRMLSEHADRSAASIELFVSKGHRDALAPLLPGMAGVLWTDVPVISGFERAFVKKVLVEVVVLFRIMRKAKRTGATAIILSIFPNALACLLLLRPMFRRVKLHIVLHGELESLIIKEKQKIHREGFWMRLALLRIFDGTWPKIYVLGSGILSRLLRKFPDQEQLRNIRVIEHPYWFHDVPRSRVVPEERIRVGFVGTGRVIKGVEDFFLLAESLSDYVVSGDVEFILVGGLEGDARKFEREGVLILSDRPTGLNATQFFEAIAALDCAVFLNRNNNSFTASGSVFDVINAGVEILSLQNHYLHDLAQSDFDRGISFYDDVSDIAAELRRRIVNGVRFKKFGYAAIRRIHSEGAWLSMRTEMFGESSGSPLDIAQ